MVAPIRELVNITLSTTATAYISNNMAPIQDINMVVNLLNNFYDIGDKFDEVSVVATTRWNGTRDMLTSAKLSVGYLVVVITRELDKELSLY